MTEAPVTRSRAAASRLEEFDVLRWAAILAVVFIHVSALAIRPGDTGLLASANRLSRFAVPAFVAMAAGLAWTHPPIPTLATWARYMGRRLLVIGVPYALFSAAYVVPAALRRSGVPGALSDWAKSVALGNAWSHLYFVPLVLVLYAVQPLAARLMERAPRAAIVASWLVAAGWWYVWDALPAIGRTWSWWLLYLPFATAGWLYVRHRGPASAALARWWPVLLLAGGAFALPAVRVPLADRLERIAVAGPALKSIVSNASDLAVLAGVAALCAMAAAAWPTLARLARRHQPLVYGVYLSHPLLVFGLAVAAKRVGVTAWLGWLSIPLTAIVLAAVSLGVWALGRSRFTAWMVGVDPAACGPASAMTERGET